MGEEVVISKEDLVGLRQWWREKMAERKRIASLGEWEFIAWLREHNYKVWRMVTATNDPDNPYTNLNNVWEGLGELSSVLIYRQMFLEEKKKDA